MNRRPSTHPHRKLPHRKRSRHAWLLSFVLAIPALGPSSASAKAAVSTSNGASTSNSAGLSALQRAQTSRYEGWRTFRGPTVPAGAIVVATLPDSTRVFALRVDSPVVVPKTARALPGNGPWPSGRVHVKLRPALVSRDQLDTEAERLAHDYGVMRGRSLRVKTWVQLDVGLEGNATALEKRLAQDPRVERVELDFVRRLEVKNFNDNVEFSKQWHLENDGSLTGYPIQVVPDADIDAVSAWGVTTGSPEVIIAVLDSGQDMTHPEYPPQKFFAPFDALNNIVGTAAPDLGDNEAAHGIACAGLAAAPRDGTTGVVGVCPDCGLMPIRILATESFSIDDSVSRGFVHAFENGASVASNSWGYGPGYAIPTLVRDSIDQFTRFGRGGFGGVTVFAIGNTYFEATDYEIALDPNVLAVGGTGFDDQRVAYSTFHPKLDIVAPTAHDYTDEGDGYQSAALVTTDRPGNEGYNPPYDLALAPSLVPDTNYTAIMSGTSGACPIAAGVAGLLLSHDPSLEYAQVFRLMTDSAEKVGPLPYNLPEGRNAEYGFGRVNAFAALTLLEAGNVCIPEPEVCGDGLDNDCDLSIDDDDLDCGFEYPVPQTNLGESCAGIAFDECGDGFCFPFGPFAGSEGFCSLFCAADDACGDNGACLNFTADGFDVQACLVTCDGGDCPFGMLCSAIQGENVCLPGCDAAASVCPSDSECVDGRCRAGGGVEPEPTPEPNPAPEPFPEPTPDFEPGVQPEPAPEVGPEIRHRPERIRIASVSSCAAVSVDEMPVLALLTLIGAMWRRRRRQSER